MKRILMISGIGIALFLIVGLTSVYVWIGKDVKENIQIAEEKYQLIGEEALIAFLQDENNKPYDRTHIAIWTLGQVRSEKALPILQDYFQDDPEGKTCYGKHNDDLCQYEIHKAILSIQRGYFLSYAQLK